MDSRLFQIKEEDLAELERSLPRIVEFLGPDAINGQGGNRLRKHIRTVRRILADVRWDYGPPQSIEVVED